MYIHRYMYIEIVAISCEWTEVHPTCYIGGQCDSHEINHSTFTRSRKALTS